MSVTWDALIVGDAAAPFFTYSVLERRLTMDARSPLLPAPGGVDRIPWIRAIATLCSLLCACGVHGVNADEV